MEAVIRGVFSAAFLYSALRVTTPILFAALGGAVAKKAGVTNIGLEGTMLASALAGVVGSAYTQSLLIGALCGIATGLLISGLLAYFAIKLKAEIFLTGLMMNMIASGATVFIMYMLTKDKGTTTKLKSLVFPQVPLPLIKDIPFVGEVVSNHNILTYLAFLSVMVFHKQDQAGNPDTGGGRESEGSGKRGHQYHQNPGNGAADMRIPGIPWGDVSFHGICVLVFKGYDGRTGIYSSCGPIPGQGQCRGDVDGFPGVRHCGRTGQCTSKPAGPG